MIRLIGRVVAIVLLALAPQAIAQEKPPQEPPPKMEPQQLGPQTEAVDAKAYARVLRVAPSGADHTSIQQALAAITDAGESKRYAVFVAAGEYKGQTVEMKPFVDLFGGFDPKGWKRDIEAQRSILDGEGQRRVVVAADNARLDGFVVRKGKFRGPGAGILCDHASPAVTNN